MQATINQNLSQPVSLPGARDWGKAVVLLGLGAYFTYSIAAGNLPNYINMRFAWLSYVAAIAFWLMGLYLVVTLAQKQHAAVKAVLSDDPLTEDAVVSMRAAMSGHTSITWSALLILSIPLVLGTLIPSRPLGVEAFNSGTATNTSVSAGSGSVSTLSMQIPPESRNILDWLRVFSAQTDPNALNGQPVDVIGFVYTEPSFGADQFMVGRYTVSCCTADASGIALPVTWEPLATDPNAAPIGAWVRVTGTLRAGEFQGETLPVIQAADVQLVEQPAQPYLYP